jgi:hypothetical protein
MLLGKSLGVTREKLVHHLATKDPDNWKEAQLIRQLLRQEEAEREIDGATDMIALRRAEAKLRSAQWNLERVWDRIYGLKKPEGDGSHKVSITLNLGPLPEEKVVLSLDHQGDTAG